MSVTIGEEGVEFDKNVNKLSGLKNVNVSLNPLLNTTAEIGDLAIYEENGKVLFKITVNNVVLEITGQK